MTVKVTEKEGTSVQAEKSIAKKDIEKVTRTVNIDLEGKTTEPVVKEETSEGE